MSERTATDMVLEARGVSKTYRQGPREVEVLRDVNMQLAAGESLAIVGVSGAGKSTLLHILGGLDEPDGGEVRVEGASLWSLGARERSRVRVDRSLDQIQDKCPEVVPLPPQGKLRDSKHDQSRKNQIEKNKPVHKF